MRKPAASDDDRDAGQPRRLTLAMAFGFAAGALLARRPAAAVTALVTGVVACINTTGKAGDSCPEDDEDSSGQGGPAVPTAKTVPAPRLPSVILDGNEFADPASPGSLEPLPDISTAPASPQIEQVDELLSLSLPEVGVNHSTEPVRGATPIINATEPGHNGEASSETAGVSSPRREVAVSRRKRSWLTWLR